MGTGTEKTYGWENVEILNDSMRLIVGDGLHLLNVRTGEGNSFPFKTGKGTVRSSTNSMSIYVSTPSVTMGIIGGMIAGAFSTVGRQLTAGVSGIASNVIHEDKVYYVAGRDILACLNKDDLSVAWSTPLNESQTSASSLFIEDGNLYIVNYGKVEKQGKTVQEGIPYIAYVDKATGGDLFMYKPSDKATDIKFFNNHNGYCAVAMLDKVAFCPLQDLSDDKWLKWDTNINGTLAGGIADGTFSPLDGGTSSFTELVTDDEYCWVYNICENIRSYDSFFSIVSERDFDVIRQRTGRTFVIDKEGKRIADLGYTARKMKIKNNILYIMNPEQNKLYGVDIDVMMNR